MTTAWQLPEMITEQKLVELLHQMWVIRFFDEKVDEFFAKGLIHGTTHLCVGQEATAAGAIAVLQPEDKITSTHRGHGHCIAKGADVNKMMAELFGRETGYCKGKGGSMHIADVDKGNLGANGIVGGGIPIAVGAALTSQMRKLGYVTISFFGDGASNEGSFHESVNMASIWKLPVIFFCENNQYGMSGPVTEMVNIEHIAERSKAYGIPGVVVDGNDLFAVMNAVAEAAERARRGEGPTLIEAKTYRYKGHSKSDAKKYRTREEEMDWRKNRDCIKKLQEVLIEKGLLTQEQAKEIEQQAKKEIEEAVVFAEESPMPSLDTLEEDVYA
ncbi:thiamine pyrophosphate-dependent dehydrogenase E1 component subunit alpha [Brevibacillus laterosporus]|uniref:Thiamine pyrophosphate-dependent dehydrogenase E1 component subunit alpha n=1 Tax=Brevibacillus laterosporus TaxID=1465 RepID=A0AAP3DIR5_BRELA|nr:thiamine pyrophosphate-dependent dehydrogenase E1 component subunit alpha [Brevibacillus laterosporus]AYB38671.1 thiamine pyrophosphate-dependent dehydrogenase E1 component subunit alpha [Brevibacillus laterosporus]MBG9771956.1 pyruvate dehydrogenase [Brevibacillus laterosporus]MBM7108899.1 Acetoin:2,6-dichlorophenolindophenol oxidoreductase subunit alpha [Brevibacillus laterosporus]MCR8981267.1 thiamine pyrophosphate-dependent dehydrogenase E1 component subunit alpha [Brevibacillus laterosp